MFKNYLRGVALCCLLGIAIQAGGQPPNQVYDLPCKQVKGLLLVHARIDGQAGWLLLDTGSPDLTLHRGHFPDAKGQTTYSSDFRGLPSSILRSRVKLGLGDLELPRSRCSLMDLSPLEKALGHPISGLLGQSILEDYELLVDFPGKRVLFIPLDKQGGQLVQTDEYRSKKAVSFRQRKHFPVFKVEQPGHPSIRLAFDTGASLHLLHDRTDLEEAALAHDLPTVAIAGLSTGILHAEQVRLQDLRIDGVINLPPWQAALVDLAAFRDQVARVDGIMGMDAMEGHIFSLNYKTKVLRMWDPVGPDGLWQVQLEVLSDLTDK